MSVGLFTLALYHTLIVPNSLRSHTTDLGSNRLQFVSSLPGALCLSLTCTHTILKSTLAEHGDVRNFRHAAG